MSPAEIGPFRCKCTCAFPHRFPRAAGHTQRTVSWFTRVERKTRPRASKRSWWREGGAEDASRLADTYFDVNKPDRDGVTPIVHAVRSHDLSLMRALYDRGAALDWKRPEMPSHWRPRGLTPLLAAVEMRAADIASELLDRGADPEAPGPDSATPLQLAVLPSGPVEMEAFSALLCSLRGEAPLRRRPTRPVPLLWCKRRRGERSLSPPQRENEGKTVSVLISPCRCCDSPRQCYLTCDMMIACA